MAIIKKNAPRRAAGKVPWRVRIERSGRGGLPSYMRCIAFCRGCTVNGIRCCGTANDRCSCLRSGTEPMPLFCSHCKELPGAQDGHDRWMRASRRASTGERAPTFDLVPVA
jgi:hypothetical protein